MTELRAAIGTEELNSGAYAKSRKLFDDSLAQPNSNSLAQAQWVSASKGLALNFNRFDLNSGQFIEAKSYKALDNKDYKKAVEYAQKWMEVEPYSTRTILYAYNLAENYLLDNDKGIEILSNAIVTHKTNPVLLNDYAYSLALNGEIDKAKQVISRAKVSDQNESDIIDICITATKGLIAFRTGDAEMGSKLYNDSISRSFEHKERPSLNHSALLNYCREMLIFKNDSETKEVVNGILSKIPETKNNAELLKLRSQVEKLLMNVTGFESY